MTYLTVNEADGFHLLKTKGQQMFESVKMMRTGDTTLVQKKDLPCFYAMARRHGLNFRRKKDGDNTYRMVMVKNAYLAKLESIKNAWGDES